MSITNSKNSKIYLIFLGLYFALIPMENIREITGGTINKYLAIIISIMIIMELLISKTVEIKINSIQKRMTLSILFWSMTLLFSYESIGSIEIFFRLILLYLCFILVSLKTYSKSNIALINTIIIIGVTAFSILAIFYNINSTNRVYFYILPGKSVDPNFFCATLILPTMIVYNKIMEKSVLYKKIFYFATLIIVLFAALLSGSRGGILAILGATAMYTIYILFNRRQISVLKKAILVIGILMLILLLIKLSFLLPNFIRDRLNSQSIKTDKGSNRFIIWGNAINVYKNSGILRQIFGYGYNSFRHVAGFGNVAHNGFVQTLLEGGIMGSVILINLFYTLFKYSKQYKSIISFALIFACIIIGMTIEIVASRYFWNIVMYVVILGQRHEVNKV